MKRSEARNLIGHRIKFDDPLCGTYVATLEELAEFTEEEKDEWAARNFRITSRDYKVRLKIMSIIDYPVIGALNVVNRTWVDLEPYFYGQDVWTRSFNISEFNEVNPTYEASLLSSINNRIRSLEFLRDHPGEELEEEPTLPIHYPTPDDVQRALNILYNKRSEIDESSFIYDPLYSESIGGRLQALRERAGYTIEDTAITLHPEYPYLYKKYEKNEHDLSLRDLIAIAKMFNVTTDWILLGDLPTPVMEESPSAAIPEPPLYLEVWRNLSQHVEELSKSDVMHITDVTKLLTDRSQNR